MYNNLRITGLASGMDTEEMIQGMMKAERIRYDKVEQEKQILLWRQEIYNDLNKDYANFILNSRKLFGLNTTTSTGSIESNSYSDLTWVKKATSSNESLATVSSTAKAMNGSYNVEVGRLAEGVKAVSSGRISGENSKTNIKEQFNLGDEAKTIEFTITTKNGSKKFSIGDNGTDINKNLSEISLSEVVKVINSAKAKVGDEEVSLGLKASYDSNIDRFFLQTEATGKESILSIGATGEDSIKFVEGLKLNVTHTKYDGKDVIRNTEKLGVGTEYKGQDALINFDGAEGIEMSTNQFTINGIDFSLKGIGEFTTTVETDVDTFYGKIEQFVKEYNELVDKTNKLLSEKKYRDYQPLSSEQKKGMEKNDIEMWEEKAKSGLLRSDEIISHTMDNSRKWLYEEVNGIGGSLNVLYQIGIDTEKYSKGTLGGKLEINETKLKEAIRKDPDGVLELLFKEPEYDEGDLKGINKYMSDRDLTADQLNAKRKQSGLINRVQDNFIYGMQDIIYKSGTGNEVDLYRNIQSNMLLDFVSKHSSLSSIDKDVLDINKKLDDLSDYLVRKENSYYAQFTAMEKAISRMNQQSMWLTQQFSN